MKQKKAYTQPATQVERAEVRYNLCAMSPIHGGDGDPEAKAVADEDIWE